MNATTRLRPILPLLTLALLLAGCGTTQVRTDQRYGSPGGAYNWKTVAVTDGGRLKSWFCAVDKSKVIVDGGEIGDHFFALNRSAVKVKSGRVGGDFKVYEKASLWLAGGVIGREDDRFIGNGGVLIFDDAAFLMTGGRIEGHLSLGDHSVGEVSGGALGPTARVDGDAVLRLDGRDFAVDSKPARFDAEDTPIRLTGQDCRITGTLANGDAVDAALQFAGNGTVLLVRRSSPRFAGG